MDSESIGEVESALAAFPGLADVTVVEPDDPEAMIGELPTELSLEVDALAAEPVDQQQHGIFVSTEGFVVQRDLAVGRDGHTADYRAIGARGSPDAAGSGARREIVEPFWSGLI